jgi:mandelate racemase
MECPKICELRVRAVRVPMAQPHKTASGTISESPLILTTAALAFFQN